MDPNATLADLIMAAINGDSESLRDSAEALATWLDRGGFAPELSEAFGLRHV